MVVIVLKISYKFVYQYIENDKKNNSIGSFFLNVKYLKLNNGYNYFAKCYQNDTKSVQMKIIIALLPF
jgi:hypothetical protein